MTRFRLCPALIAGAWLTLLNTGLDARPAALQDGRQAPASPAPVYDPVSGPFLATVDGTGALRDAGVVDNAIRSWTGPRLSAYLLCFRPGSGPMDWTVAMNALDHAARALDARGAAIVVIEPGRVCATPPNASMAGKPHVEIKGVLRGRG